tara:strand:+ start:58 stop:732 length:675 start_codon:yes stop_codon:yes gene_type:complete
MLKIISIIFALFVTLFIDNLSNAETKDKISIKELVQRSVNTFQHIKLNKDLKNFGTYFQNSKAILIFPEVYEGSLIFGAKAGTGVLVIKGDEGWFGPFFYTLGGVSVGLQFGIKTGKVIFTIMTERGLKSLLKEKIKFGIDLDAAVANKGIGYSAESTLRLADIYSFSENIGLFLGGSLDGTFLKKRNDLNFSFHGERFSVDEILEGKEINLKKSNLTEILEKN